MSLDNNSTNINKITTCEVCSQNNLKEVLDLGNHPLCDDLKAVNSTDQCDIYPIKIGLCLNCNTAHQKYQVTKKILFTQNYHYRARFTQDVLNGMQDIVSYCENKFGNLNNLKILDIGCNDGSLLNFFYQKHANCIGVEPTKAIEDVSFSGDFYNFYFDLNLANEIHTSHGFIDIIIFTNVFAHIENLNSLLESLKILIGPNTKIIIENHYLGAVLDKHQFDTFYHEHPRTYSAKSFVYISKKLGLNINQLSFPKRYGGNIRVVMSKDKNICNNMENIINTENGFQYKFEQMNKFIINWKSDALNKIKLAKQKHGILYGKAFPGRAAILIKLLGLDSNTINAIFEKDSSAKIDHYVPGTKIPIIKDCEIDKKQPKCIINFAWHIKDEISAYLKDYGYKGEVINIL